MADDPPSFVARPQDLAEGNEIEQAFQKEMRKDSPLSKAGCLLRGMIATFVLKLFLCGGGYVLVQAWHRGYAAKRDALISDLRSQGEPLSAEDLEEFAALPEGTNDLTQRYLRILQNYETPRPLLPGEEKLPVSGVNDAKPVPGHGAPWPEEDVAKNYLANRPWLSEAEDLAEIEGGVCFLWDYSQGFAGSFGKIKFHYDLIRDLEFQFEVRMWAGDRHGALRSLRAMFKVSRSLERDPTVISQLVQVALHGKAWWSARALLDQGKATREEIASLREVLDNDFHTSLVRALKGERALALITLRSQNFTQVSEGFETKAMSNFSSSNVADARPGDTTKLLELLTECIKAAEGKDFPETIKQFRILNDSMGEMFKADEKGVFPWNRHVVTSMLLPMVPQLAESLARSSALQSALRAALDVEEKLLDLPPGARTKEAEIAAIQEFLPVDPFTGQPMKYVVDEQGYKIYSVGLDGVDDTVSGGNPYNDNGVSIERTLDGSAKGNSAE